VEDPTPAPSSISGPAIDKWDACREMAMEDSDFDPIRDEPAFAELISR